MPAKTSSNHEIAKRANAHARADFATWQMMARLRSVDALPSAAQNFYAQYRTLTEKPNTSEESAAEATIALVYAQYYVDMGGTGKPPRIAPAPAPQPPARPASYGDNVTPFRRVAPAPPPKAAAAKPRPAVPTLAIFAALVAVAVLVHYLRGGF